MTNSAVCWELREDLALPEASLLQVKMRRVMRTISREVAESSRLVAALTPQRLHAELLAVSASSARAYLLGALHDATISGLHKTVRFGQSNREWLEGLSILLERIGRRSWIYREGQNRTFWVLETSASWVKEASALEDGLAYARGYFDAEGGIPRDPEARFYVQFVQKNRPDIEQLRELLIEAGIRCGQLHNPSRLVDPDLWRFYVRAESHDDFITKVSSWHPRKRYLFEVRKASKPG